MPNESTSPSPHEQSFDPRSRPAATGRGAPPPSAARNGRPSAWRIMDPVRRRIHVAMALAARSASNAAGKHIRQSGAQRRADKVALQKLLRRQEDA